MLQNIITSKTRIKLLLKFFLNKNTKSYLRNLEAEFGESTNAIRIELNRLESAGLLTSELLGNKKYFRANTHHPLFSDIHNILIKTIGIDQILEHVTSKIGDLKEAYLVGDLALGRDSKIIDILLYGNEINGSYVSQLVEKVEKHMERKIRYLILNEDEKNNYLQRHDHLLIWRI
ncbi:ArsR family transcriptional regulator [Maribellus sp. YY47]|uniref:ArsR family transcriptional regulator n=1 Tax=Maribellus sp. YY47 TaxID=2929486 RepID=UPI002001B10E|nr:ArsR family transcriptional regulator [Maribellus sp. YY47]MCK3685184.1 ArsR family transcriptional regulator [Maribellus sp. YY47]